MSRSTREQAAARAASARDSTRDPLARDFGDRPSRPSSEPRSSRPSGSRPAGLGDSVSGAPSTRPPLGRERRARKHFSMIRGLHLADAFTLANAACGVGAVMLLLTYMSNHRIEVFFFAATLLPAALVFDVFDGSIARWRHTHSALGRELDSLADIISFGVAPAALGFAAGLNGGWDAPLLVYFVCCGVARLARYNVTAESLSAGADKVPYFEGTPIPTSVVLVAVLAFAAWQARVGDSIYGGAWAIGPWVLHPLTLLFALSGTLMISKTLHIPKP